MRVPPLMVLSLAALLAVPAFPSHADAQRRDRDREREEEERDRDRAERQRRAEEARRAAAERRREVAVRRAEALRRARELRLEREREWRDREFRPDRRDRRRWRDRSDMLAPRNLTLAVGVFDYDFAFDGDNVPMAALRADWRLTRWLRSEVDVSYALGTVSPPLSPSPAPSDDDRSSSLGAATVGIQAELPIPYVRPYAGVAVGLFGRSDEGDDGASFVRPTTAFPVGVRVALSRRLALRGEVRFRYDQHEDNTTARDVERTVGLSFGF